MELKKQRQTNFELCRMSSMLLVMFVHSTFNCFGWNTTSFGLQLLAGFTIVGVNVFVLITGYFSTTPRKSTFVYLIYFCFFWMIIKILVRYFNGEDFDYKNLFFVTTSNWFIPSYIGLLLLTPALNACCEKLSCKSMWLMVVALLFIEIWFDWIPPYPPMSLGTQKGYSVLSFAILYLLARAIRLYGLPMWFKRLSPIIWVVCSFIMAIGAHILVSLDHAKSVFSWYAYDNPIVILSSVSFLLCFEQLNCESKFINYIAKSTLACYFGHMAIFFMFKQQFVYLFNNFSGIILFVYWTLAVFIVFLASITIDQLRIITYKPIEAYVRKKIKNNVLFE